MNPSFDKGMSMIGSLFGFGATNVIDVTAGYYFKTEILLFVICIMAARPFLKKVMDKITERSSVVAVVLYGVLFCLCIAGLVFNSYQPFLYMQF